MKGARPRQRRTSNSNSNATTSSRLAIPLLSLCALIMAEIVLLKNLDLPDIQQDKRKAKKIHIGTPLEVNVLGHAVKALYPSEKCSGFDMFDKRPAPYCSGEQFMRIPYAMNKSYAPIFLCHVSLFRRSQQVVGDAVKPQQNCVYKLSFGPTTVVARIGVVHEEMPHIFTHFHFDIDIEKREKKAMHATEALGAIKDVRLTQSRAVPYDSGSIPFTYTATWKEVARGKKSAGTSNINNSDSFVGGGALVNAALLMYALGILESSISTFTSTSTPGGVFPAAMLASFVCCGTHLFCSTSFGAILTAPVISFAHPFFLSNTVVLSVEAMEVLSLVAAPFLSLLTSGNLSASAYFTALFLIVLSYPLFHHLVTSFSLSPSGTGSASISVYRCALLALPPACAFIPVVFRYVQALATHNAPPSMQMLECRGVALFHALVFAASGFMIARSSEHSCDSTSSAVCSSLFASSYLVVYAMLLNLRSPATTSPQILPARFWAFAGTLCFSGASASFLGATLHSHRYRTAENTNLANKLSP